MPDFQDALDGKPLNLTKKDKEKLTQPSDDEILQEISASNEKEYYTKLKKKNKNYLLKLSYLERERIAQYIYDRYTNSLDKDLEAEYEENDEVYRMVRQQIPGDDGTMPNYRSALSTVSLEVMHANVMNVLFAPKDAFNVLPTEEADIKKSKKLATFCNWSMDNEMKLYENIDRLFHSSGKNGECPYIIHWVKEYGTEIKREILMDPVNPGQPLYDPDTKEPLYQEREVQKLLYNGPKLEIISRKDYIQPKNALMGKLPNWEMMITRINYDDYLREYLQGKMYDGSIMDITDWTAETPDSNKIDFEGVSIPVGKYEQEFITFYGRMKVNTIKKGLDNEQDTTEELEDEFIGLVHINSQTLCSFRKNKFPMKMRPVDIDYFIPDDEGRRKGTGMMKFMEGAQKAYDALFNQYIFGTMQANNPVIFYTPMSNMRREPIKIKNGYMYPTADPKSIAVVKLPPPDASMQAVLELINQWAQLMFGVSDYSAGVESKIDPTAPARKAEIVLGQGSVRMNLILKRKIRTLQNIGLRWYLLYRENLPPNKFMRIVGEDKDNPFKFDAIKIEDFALKALPDFLITGNTLNSNKKLMVQTKLSIYRVLSQNPMFMPQTMQGIKNLHSLTKWLVDGLDELGLSRLIPAPPGDRIYTPEEENARFLQGDDVMPTEEDDFVDHVRKHQMMLLDQGLPEPLRQKIAQHIQEHIRLLQSMIAAQTTAAQAGGMNAVTGGAGQRPTGAPGPMAQGAPAGMEGLAGGVPSLPQ